MKSLIQEISNDIELPKYILESDVNVPAPEHCDIVIQVKACALSVINPKVFSEVNKKNSKNRFPVGHDVSGVVVKVGSSVTHVMLGDDVVGIVSIDSKYSGCGEYCLMSEYEVVKKPEKLSYSEAAAGIGDCVNAYTALHYQAKVCGGDTVLVIDGSSHFGSITLQLASLWGAKVIATASSPEERNYLENLSLPVAQVIDLSTNSNILVSSVMEETGGVGVDIVIDNGVRLFKSEEDIISMEEKSKFPVPHKHDIISCLGVFGKWITSRFDLQLDPPDSQSLFMRGSSVGLLFNHVWTLSCTQLGRYQHILHDSVDKLENGVIKCRIVKEVKLDEAADAMKSVEDLRMGKIVVTM